MLRTSLGWVQGAWTWGSLHSSLSRNAARRGGRARRLGPFLVTAALSAGLRCLGPQRGPKYPGPKCQVCGGVGMPKFQFPQFCFWVFLFFIPGLGFLICTNSNSSLRNLSSPFVRMYACRFLLGLRTSSKGGTVPRLCGQSDLQPGPRMPE